MTRLLESLHTRWQREMASRGGPIVFGIAGPTAVGKTALSLELAEAMNAEIMSGDSRQVYRGIDIGTAKPSTEELQRIPHHFIDERALDEPWTAVDFAEEAEARIDLVHTRGKNVLVVGGSTFYMDALLYGRPGTPALPAEISAALQERLTAGGLADLVAELLARVPEASDTVDLTNPRRVVRALGTVMHTGRLPAAFPRRIVPRHPSSVVVLGRPRAELYHRIEARCDAMLASGLLDEVTGLRTAGWAQDLPALNTIGYREPWAYLDGAISYDEMTRLLKRNTRRYAKRQLTYFRNQWCETPTLIVA